jgi:hypothetical protein
MGEKEKCSDDPVEIRAGESLHDLGARSTIYRLIIVV